MIYYQVIKIMNGYLPKVKTLYNIGHAYYKKHMLNFMVVIIKSSKANVIKFCLSLQMDFQLKFCYNNINQILMVYGQESYQAKKIGTYSLLGLPQIRKGIQCLPRGE